MSKNCPNKQKGLRCFKCEKFAHQSTDCVTSKATKTTQAATTSSSNVNMILKNEMTKKVLVNGKEVNAYRVAT